MATTGWWSWLVIHTSHINPQNLFKEQNKKKPEKMNIIDITPIHAGHPKKPTKSTKLDDQQGPGSIQFPVDEIPRRLACPPARLGCRCSRPRSRHKESPGSLRHFTPGLDAEIGGESYGNFPNFSRWRMTYSVMKVARCSGLLKHIKPRRLCQVTMAMCWYALFKT